MSANDLQRHVASASQALQRGDLQVAVVQLSKASRLSPRDPQIHLSLGTVYAMGRQWVEARRAFMDALRCDPSSSSAQFELGRVESELGDFAAAEIRLKSALASSPQNVQAWLFLSRVFSDQSRIDDAILVLRDAIVANPESSTLLNSLATRLQEVGNFDEARQLFAQSAETQPSQGFAFWGLAQGKKVTETDRDLLARMRSVLANEVLSPDERVHLLFGLGKAYDDLKEYEQAFEYFSEANRIQDESLEQSRPFNMAAVTAAFDSIKRSFTREFIEANRSVQKSSPAPIFIVGMMRSGTTLIEQVLSSHRRVAPGGEIHHWMEEFARCFNTETGKLDLYAALGSRKKYDKRLRSISSEADRVTDKMPGNYRALGLITILYPNAKIVHCIRNPVDTCLSTYMTPFRQPPEYARNLDKLLFTYRNYSDLMSHWHEVLPDGSMLDVSYEGFVEDSEATTRRVIEFCDLDWDPACLRPELNDRPVTTASVWQARQPTYTTSIERWRSYEPWLGPLRELL